jgi:hypothetical protein
MNIEYEQCDICQDDMHIPEMLRCEHSFCTGCLVKNQINKCPLCGVSADIQVDVEINENEHNKNFLIGDPLIGLIGDTDMFDNFIHVKALRFIQFILLKLNGSAEPRDWETAEMKKKYMNDIITYMFQHHIYFIDYGFPIIKLVIFHIQTDRQLKRYLSILERKNRITKRDASIIIQKHIRGFLTRIKFMEMNPFSEARR